MIIVGDIKGIKSCYQTTNLGNTSYPCVKYYEEGGKFLAVLFESRGCGLVIHSDFEDYGHGKGSGAWRMDDPKWTDCPISFPWL
jgi:hypothetical protein